jgi:hypothetical protein
MATCGNISYDNDNVMLRLRYSSKSRDSQISETPKIYSSNHGLISTTYSVKASQPCHHVIIGVPAPAEACLIKYTWPQYGFSYLQGTKVREKRMKGQSISS